MYVKLDRSIATIRPTIVTRIAAVLADKGMVRIGVFIGGIFEAIISPAIMLPQARRLIGFSAVGLFSLIGLRDGDRGWPMEAK